MRRPRLFLPSLRLACALLAACGSAQVAAQEGASGVPAASSAPASAEAASGARATLNEQVKRGAYLVRAGDCISCHTAPGGAPFAGGLPTNTGFGVVYSPNLTPDKETGIGSWTEDDFYRAMHEGRDDEGKHLYPAFPYQWFTKVTRDDVDAVKAYLDSLEPVHQPNKPPQMDWFLKWRGVMAPWNWINFHAGQYQPDPNRSAQWNRGAYLVEGLGHCGQCHTPKGIFGGNETSQALEGGLLPEGWYAPGLAGDLRTGLGRWSEAQIAEYLKTGSTARTAPAGPMSEVIAHSTSYMSDGDLKAIATYLKAMPVPGNGPKVEALGHAALARGQAVFIDNCAACHMADGRGQPNAFPTLTSSSAIQAREPATLIRVVLEGQRIVSTTEKPTGLAMPAFREKLDDQQVADVVNYIRNAWGNRGSLTDARAIADARKSLAAAHKLLESSRR